MENALKRRSLTLTTRLLHKRHSASPQSVRTGHNVSVSLDTPGSPNSSAVVGITSDLESTPPHKHKPSLDDSVDFSPRLDISLSPSCLFSQTLATESPEVGWRWNQWSSNATTDSGFDSAEIGSLSQRERRRQIVFKGVEDRRSQLDNEQWRAQQMRANVLLKERCARLNSQLEQIAVSEPVIPLKTPKVSSPVAPRTRSACAKATPVLPPAVAPDPMADFLNDSETDLFLLEASQQLESKIEHHEPPKPSTSNTPTRHHTAKRPSFYMKFLEDESEGEDWLNALEEAVQQATMPKKPRTSLQRYKSMPTTGDSCSGVSTLTNVTANSNACTSASSASGSELRDTPRIKRHASSHALSPATSHARGKLFGSRK
ncbi:uncharacterized protein LOC6729767 [Drosophila simulans]|uniref:GD18122 n=1 Tax=Drosophila simulans TaxID=7240 RepID=B4QWQ9_DROSI|nr:uncharacterized protein LOC6729767 [Drosophila simulans]XP_016036453.1 uncharacterized protein LOC6729767 [Drosophila simulans]XP_044779421.1 uncharacterized protein LOC6729767 [Drosophila simulans]EDX14576.1 GD18122 [Drosophila simulans]KMZ06122.1 uncharacterized protein Dsimw501_GD18122, isoform A [Drosophila simulans]KMZ06123.1 uncharacterized protein Dsimw501_GD18122, isoform B [Drosophila simulans]